MDETNYIYHTDHLGSITHITNEKGEVVETYEYKTYGEPKIKNSKGEIIQQSAIGNPFLFTAREYDTETGLYFYRSRYYDAEIGRFIQEDPIGINISNLNLYEYVKNNPVKFIDPFGLYCGPGKAGDVIIPDKWWGKYDLSKACQKHDECFDKFGWGNSYCNKEFYINLTKECEKLKGFWRLDCLTIIKSYSYGVNIWSWIYSLPQKITKNIQKLKTIWAKYD